MAFTPAHATSVARGGLTAALGRVACAGAIAALLALAGAAPALAAAPAANFTLHSFAIPTRFSATDNESKNCSSEAAFVGCDAYQVTATNAGAAPTDASAVVLTDTLPGGVTVERVAFFWSGLARFTGGAFPNTTDLAEFGFCTTTPVKCELPFPVAPDDTLEMVIYLQVPDETATLSNAAVVEGGGAPKVSTEAQNPLGGPLPAFGPSSFSAYIANAAGQPATQAGEHPYELTTRIDLQNAFRIEPNSLFGADTVEDPKDLSVDLPLGFLGSATATPKCTFAQLSSHISNGEGGCPADTIVGHILTEPILFNSVNGPVYNMVPEHGVAAEFGFVDLLAGAHVLYASVVPTPAGYVLRTTAPDIPQVPLADIIVTLYGDPAAKDAPALCGEGQEPKEVSCRAEVEKSALPFFTNPSDCRIDPATDKPFPLTTTVHMDSWESPARLNADGTPDLSDPSWVSASSASPGMTGCDRLRFDASLTLQPDTSVADSPSGVDVEIKVPQTEQPGTLATPPLKRALVTLPAGFTVDPSAAGGLGACSPSQIALAGAAKPTCPDASKIGTVELSTPLLPGVLKGSIYLATQNENPFKSLLAVYLVVDDPDTGTIVKIPGNLTPDPNTGQISGVFDNNPQFPFSDLRLHFKGGPRGALATPESCGSFTSTSALTPWSAPDSGLDATPFDAFTISSGCVAGFAPSFTAGTTLNQAGAFTPFVLSLSRADTDQELSGLSVTLAPGLLARVAGVARCSDAALAQAAAPDRTAGAELASPSCPAGSQVGTVQAGAGPGPTPFFTSGKAYLTGPYRGAPYGLAVIVPALAGPFDLGNVLVRTSLRIDPTDAHVSAVSDPFPTILKGIPIRLRRVEVTLDRPRFTFNPTSCEAMAINATLSSTQGLTAPVSSRFQAGGCAALPFKPSFTASTQGHTSKAGGASLTVRVKQNPGEADIRKVILQLPRALPSRLTTLQKACTEAQFNTNPAGCPEASNIGTATAVTPILNVPLTGPAVLVSHGGAAFPDVEFLLQGEGVHITLDGKTDIKGGITYSRFETVPDAPISSFEAVLPEGPHSALGANRNLCAPTKTVTIRRRVARRVHGRLVHVLKKLKRTVAAPLLAPTTITAQNKALLKQTTKIAVTGCAKATAKSKGSRGKRGGRRRRG